jgi:hypothetical protein
MSLAVTNHLTSLNEKLHLDNFLEADDAALDAAIVKFQQEQSSVRVC